MREYRVACKVPGESGLWIRTVNAEYEADAVDSGSALCAREVGRNWADIDVVEVRETMEGVESWRE